MPEFPDPAAMGIGTRLRAAPRRWKVATAVLLVVLAGAAALLAAGIGLLGWADGPAAGVVTEVPARDGRLCVRFDETGSTTCWRPTEHVERQVPGIEAGNCVEVDHTGFIDVELRVDPQPC